MVPLGPCQQCHGPMLYIFTTDPLSQFQQMIYIVTLYYSIDMYATISTVALRKYVYVDFYIKLLHYSALENTSDILDYTSYCILNRSHRPQVIPMPLQVNLAALTNP